MAGVTTTSSSLTSSSHHTNPNEIQYMANLLSVDDPFKLLESSGNPEVVQEIKQLIYEQYNEGIKVVLPYMG